MALPRLAAATVVAKPCLALARVLARSFSQLHPTIPFFVLLADEVEGRFDPEAEPGQIIPWSALPSPATPRLRFVHPQQPLSYAATPFLIEHLLDRGFERVLFFKQESLVLGDHSPVFDRLGERSIVMTPHLLEPLSGDDRVARELNILQSGVCNVGLLGVSDRPIARAFLSWWQDRVASECRLSVAEGLHYEQRWLDLVPGFFPDVELLSDPAYNVGHWNLPERDISIRDGSVYAGESPCRLFRFSGYNPDAPRVVTRYSPRLTPELLGPAWQVFEDYRARLEEAGYHDTKTWPYAYDHFDNGVPVPEIARVMFRELGDDVDRFGDPFCTGSPTSFFAWLNGSAEPRDGAAGPRTLSRLWRRVYDHRLDVREAFPDLEGDVLEAYLAWTIAYGAAEVGVPPALLPPDRS